MGLSPVGGWELVFALFATWVSGIIWGWVAHSWKCDWCRQESQQKAKELRDAEKELLRTARRMGITEESFK
jgi:hypothetical protein